MMNSRYWKQRQRVLMKGLDKHEEQLNKKLYRYYNRLAKDAEDKIHAYFSRYGKDQVIEYNDLFNTLDQADIQILFQDMDRFSNKYPQYKHLMPVRDSIYKLNRLQGLEQTFRTKLAEMGAIEENEINRHLNQTAEKFYASTQDFFIRPQSNQYRHIDFSNYIGRNWTQASDYSNKIWTSKNNLTQAIHKDLVDGFVRGDSPQRIASQMSKRLGKEQHNNIKRIIRTENTFMANEAMAQAVDEHPTYEEYTFSAVNDSRTSKVCSHLDGQTFKFADREPGVNFPPMHPNCRSSFTIVIPDEWADWTEDEIRSLLDEGWTQEEVDDLINELGYNKSRSIEHLQRQLPYTWKGEQNFIPGGAEFRSTKVIAGKGSNTRLRIAKNLERDYDISSQEWKKKVGKIESAKYIFDVHWYEADSTQYRPKLKFRGDKK